MSVNRVERHQIKRGHIAWKPIDRLCFKSKNLYNYANYIVRQEFVENGNYKGYYEMKMELKNHELFKDFGSQTSQQTLSMLDRAWRAFFESMGDWSENPKKYLGKPQLPGYKKDNGRYPVVLSNIQFRIEDGFIRFSWKPLKILNNIFRTHVNEYPTEIRFIPTGSTYVMEIVYRKDVPHPFKHSSNVIGIDMGVNNLVTISNNIGAKPIIINGRGIKSINQYYNKKRRKLFDSLTGHNWSNGLQKLTDKYVNKVDYFLHKVSKYIIHWCAENNIDTIVIGKNDRWKQKAKLGRNTQSFVQIPHARLIDKITYKAEDAGIKVILTEESYTSGTSFLDGELPTGANYDKSRRIKRGLFESNNGTLINADLNGAYQIVRKVFPNAFDGIEDVHLHPVRINVG